MKFLKRITTFEYLEPALVATALALGALLWLAGFQSVAEWLWAITSIVGVIKPIGGMIRTLRDGQLGVDIIAVVAIVASVALHENLAAIVVLLMLTGGEALEDYAQRRAQSELSDLLKRAPSMAHIKRDKEIKNIPVAQVVPGDILVVRPGETVPVDAKITSGQTSVDESAITGESLPVDKKEGDELLSGSVNTTGLIEVEALRASGDSQYARIVKLVQDAASSRSPLVRLADQYSVPFSIITFTLAGLAWIIAGEPLRALEVLVVATPCPLLIATPVALVSGMSRAAKYGIIVKHGAALEQLARLQAVAFDKTGTLTRGTPEVTSVMPYGRISKGELLRITASAERSSVHTLAHAVVAEAHRHKLKLSAATSLVESAGNGIVAAIDGKQVVVGKSDFLHERGIAVKVEGEETSVQTAIFVGIDGKFAGAILFADTLRPETKEALAGLTSLGIAHTVMLTGDRQEVADRIAARVGITDVKAQLLPEDKVIALHDVRNSFAPVAMVGDGVNDAPTLAAADVGIALGAKGSTAASESADVVIMRDDLRLVPTSVAIAARAMMIARQSIWVGIGLSIILMVIAMFGVIPPVYGALLQEAVDVTVIINALRAHYGGTLPGLA